MQAVVHDRYGPPEVLHLDEIACPVPAGDEVLVRVRATTVTRSDCGFRSASPFFSRLFTGIRRPRRRVVGTEFAGVVEAIGADVSEFVVGDEVFGFKGGANAEYVCVSEGGSIGPKPAGMSFEEAAATCDGASIARACLRKVDLDEGKRILIYGATGAIGTAAVQLAKATGAHVTAVGNTKNLELVRSLGADEVIDYEHEDFTKNGETYDVVLDAVGKHSFRRCKSSLGPGGTFPGEGRPGRGQRPAQPPRRGRPDPNRGALAGDPPLELPPRRPHPLERTGSGRHRPLGHRRQAPRRPDP